MGGFVGKLLSGGNIHIYYIVGIIMFMSLFIIILVRTFRMKKEDVIAYKTAILDNAETEQDSPIN